MTDRIKEHVGQIFENLPTNITTIEIKEELLANLLDKYSDFIASGISKEEGFERTIASIGDINGLLGTSIINGVDESKEGREKRALLLSIGTALCILSIPFTFLANYSSNEILSSFIFFLFIAIGIGCIIYGNIAGGFRYERSEDTFVEEYREKLSDENRNKRLSKSLSSSLWMVTVVIYLLISFFSVSWSVSWIIFPIAAVLQQIIIYAFSGKYKRSKLWHGILWTATVVVYFITSFTTFAWHVTWIIFVAAAAVEQIIRFIKIWKEEEIR